MWVEIVLGFPFLVLIGCFDWYYHINSIWTILTGLVMKRKYLNETYSIYRLSSVMNTDSTFDHLNNVKYLMYMDFAREDYWCRSGLFKFLWKVRAFPLQSASIIRYIRIIPIFTPIRIDTKVQHFYKKFSTKYDPLPICSWSGGKKRCCIWSTSLSSGKLKLSSPLQYHGFRSRDTTSQTFWNSIQEEDRNQLIHIDLRSGLKLWGPVAEIYWKRSNWFFSKPTIRIIELISGKKYTVMSIKLYFHLFQNSSSFIPVQQRVIQISTNPVQLPLR